VPCLLLGLVLLPLSLEIGDTAPPVVVDFFPAGTINDPRPLISVILADRDSGLDTSSVTLSIDGGVIPRGLIRIEEHRSAIGLVWNVSYKLLKDLDEGAHYVGVNASDLAGNKLGDGVGFIFTFQYFARNQPAAVAIISVRPIPLRTGDDAEFTATADAIEIAGRLEAWEWDFGDGSRVSGTFPTHPKIASLMQVHRYEAPGNYTVRFRAIDDSEEWSDWASMRVLVQSALTSTLPSNQAMGRPEQRTYAYLIAAALLILLGGGVALWRRSARSILIA
jgi:hypothetical protein